jgi:hypothetical protein
MQFDTKEVQALTYTGTNRGAPRSNVCPSTDAPSFARHDSVVPPRPIRSSVPDSDGVGDVPPPYTANLTLDEPPLIARTEVVAGAMNLKPTPERPTAIKNGGSQVPQKVD